MGALLAVPTGVLLYSASFKVLSTGQIVATLKALGIPVRLSHATGRALPAFEVVTAIAVAGYGPSWVGTAAAGAVAGGMAAAGLRGLQLGGTVPCACFSARSTSTLGWHQVWGSICFASVAVLLGVAAPGPHDGDTAPYVLLAGSLLAVIAHGRGLAADLSLLAGYRRAASGVYPA